MIRIVSPAFLPWGPLYTNQLMHPSSNEQKSTSNVNVRFITLPTLPGLTADRRKTSAILTDGFNNVEAIAGLKRSRANIAWETTANLSKIISGANKRGMLSNKNK